MSQHPGEPALTVAPGADLINGRRGEPSIVLGIAEDPNTGRPAGEIRATDAGAVDEALAAAERAWSFGDGSWSALPTVERLRLLRRFAAELDARSAELAVCHAREVGIPLSAAKMFAAGLPGLVEGVAGAAEDVLRPKRLDAPGRRVEVLQLPWGPAALLASWNVPAFVAVTKLSNALAAGCPAVLKPSEHAPATTELLVEALVDADLGAGAVQVVCGAAEVGRQLVADPRMKMVSYTGGTAGGQAVAEAAVARMAALQLELSASNPAVVLRGADLETAARELARGTVVLNGQWCEAPRRVFVDRADHDRLVALLLDRMGEYTIGHSLDPDTDIGPLAYRLHFERVTAQLRQMATQGEAVASHGVLPERGFFLSPTVVGGLSLDAVPEEIFGPVLAVHPYADLEEAVQSANRLGDGLAGYVFGADLGVAFDLGTRLHVGEVRINGVRIADLAPGSSQSFWGVSGSGGHGRVTALEAHVGHRVIGEEDPDLPI